MKPDTSRRPILDPLEEAIVFAIREAARLKREREALERERKVANERRPAA